MRRFHVYPVRHDNRKLVSVQLIRDRDLLPSTSYYTMKVGVAKSGRVDYYGTFDGSKDRLKADEPYTLYSGATVLTKGQSVVLDVTAVGIPADLESTSCLVEIGSNVQDPGYSSRNRAMRDAVDGIADHFRDTLAESEFVNLLLPRRVLDAALRGDYHDESAVAFPIPTAHPTFSASAVSISVSANPDRPQIVMVTAHATFEALLANAILYLGIYDGSTTRNPHYQQIVTIGDKAHVATSYAEAILQDRTYAAYVSEQAPGSLQILQHSISAVTVES